MSWLNVLATPIIAVMAIGSGRRIIFWSVAAFCLGFWAVLVLAFLPKKALRPLHLPKMIENRIKFATIRKWSQGVNYVEDIA